MPKGIFFWVFMILWFLSWVGTRWGPESYRNYGYVNDFLFFALFFILGWHAFGFFIY
jgi:hypothetical protein